VFGGRATAPEDQEVLNNLVNTLFQPKSFDVDFKLVPDVEDGPALPDGNARSDCIDWIESLPDHTPPSGLDSAAEEERSKRTSEGILEKVSLVGTKCEIFSVMIRMTRV